MEAKQVIILMQKIAVSYATGKEDSFIINKTIKKILLRSKYISFCTKISIIKRANVADTDIKFFDKEMKNILSDSEIVKNWTFTQLTDIIAAVI